MYLYVHTIYFYMILRQTLGAKYEKKLYDNVIMRCAVADHQGNCLIKLNNELLKFCGGVEF